MLIFSPFLHTYSFELYMAMRMQSLRGTQIFKLMI